MDFNVFDAVVISITIILAIKGYFSGLIKEIAGLVGIAAGLFFGSMYYQSAGEYINSSIMKIPNESAINVVGFVAVFVLVWLAVVLMGLIISKILQVAHLGIADRLGGVLFSAGKFFVIVSVIVTLLGQIEFLKPHLEKYQKNSIMWPIMESIGQKVIHLKPEDIQKQIDDVKQKVDNKVKEQLSQKIEDVKNKIADKVAKDIENNTTKGE